MESQSSQYYAPMPDLPVLKEQPSASALVAVAMPPRPTFREQNERGWERFSRSTILLIGLLLASGWLGLRWLNRVGSLELGAALVLLPACFFAYLLTRQLGWSVGKIMAAVTAIMVAYVLTTSSLHFGDAPIEQAWKQPITQLNRFGGNGYDYYPAKISLVNAKMMVEGEDTSISFSVDPTMAEPRTATNVAGTLSLKQPNGVDLTRDLNDPTLMPEKIYERRLVTQLADGAVAASSSWYKDGRGLRVINFAEDGQVAWLYDQANTTLESMTADQRHVYLIVEEQNWLGNVEERLLVLDSRNGKPLWKSAHFTYNIRHHDGFFDSGPFATQDAIGSNMIVADDWLYFTFHDQLYAYWIKP